MKVCVAGHLAIDQIRTPRFEETSLGGAPCYAGLTARNMGCAVACITKFGPDLADQQLLWLGHHQLQFQRGARHPTKPTTRFELRLDRRGRRTVRLLSRCADLSGADFEGAEGEALIANPLAGELPLSLLTDASSRFAWVYLDPQGFLRRFQVDGRVSLGPAPNGLLRQATIVKADGAEAQWLTGETDAPVAARRLVAQGARIVLITQGRRRLLLFHGKAAVRIPVPRVEALDTTGAGDILGGAFVAMYARDHDPVWSACVGVAAAALAVTHRGLGKIPAATRVIELAEQVKEKVRRNT